MTQDHLTRTVAAIETVAEEKLPDTTAETAIADLPIDSLDLFTVISDLEEATGRSMTDEEMGALATVGDLVKHFFG